MNLMKIFSILAPVGAIVAGLAEAGMGAIKLKDAIKEEDQKEEATTEEGES